MASLLFNSLILLNFILFPISKLEIGWRNKSQTTADIEIFVELQQIFHQPSGNREGCSTDIPLGADKSGKILKVVVDTNDFDEYEFRLFMDGVPLDAYMEEHKQRYNAWIIERLGSKLKLVFDGNQENMFFRGQNIETEKTQPSFEVSVWEGKFKEEYTFRIVKTLEGMGQLTAVLYVNGEKN
ncbi:hypothetical protein CAEBREN_04076 [Caenorhabditis brenneri]|uniref:Galectin n=1 Tax=Caenorhabditis brenneri TaxID=135651 RepID=G0NM89_CAEBE|nr:hypothetical protein CAEBREN_04076 [Caenorhabditis brenneri]